MARENVFNFLGQVVNVPIVLYNEHTENYRIVFTMKVVRKKGRTDYPRINVYDLSEEEAKEYVSKMRPGVFAMVRGMIYTNVVQKLVRCESCGNVNSIDTFQTEILSYGKPYVMKEKPDVSEVVEFSNRGYVLGSLCSPVYRRDGASGNAAAQFQLAISRKYHTKDMDPETRTDYPWVKVFGGTAEECLKRLQVGSQIYAICAFQTRDIERTVKCKSCDHKLNYEERLGEIVPTSVEFLNLCLFEKKDNESGRETHEEKV